MKAASTPLSVLALVLKIGAGSPEPPAPSPIDLASASTSFIGTARLCSRSALFAAMKRSGGDDEVDAAFALSSFTQSRTRSNESWSVCMCVSGAYANCRVDIIMTSGKRASTQNGKRAIEYTIKMCASAQRSFHRTSDMENLKTAPPTDETGETQKP